jgi:hypothetical protein
MREISPNPICVYWWESGSSEKVDSCLYFHADYPNYTFDEFCLNVIIPAIKTLQSNGNTVNWGYVNYAKYTVDEYERTLKILVG